MNSTWNTKHRSRHLVEKDVSLSRRTWARLVQIMKAEGRNPDDAYDRGNVLGRLVVRHLTPGRPEYSPVHLWLPDNADEATLDQMIFTHLIRKHPVTRPEKENSHAVR